MKRYSILLLTIFAFAVGYVVAQPPVKARIAGLEDNAEYMSLLADGVGLQQVEDSVMRVIEQNRKLFVEDPTNREKYGEVILALEEKVFSIRNRKGDIFSRINTIEQDWLIENMNSSSQVVESEVQPTEEADTIVEQAAIQPARLIDDIHFVSALDSADYVALQRAQDDEYKVIEYVNMLSENHAAMESIRVQYEQTQDAAEATRLYSNYKVLNGLCSALNDSISTRWSSIFDAKSFAYTFMLEKERRDDLLENSELALSQALQRAADDRGRFASDAMSSYFNTKKCLISTEIELARMYGLGFVQDSLSKISRHLESIDYRLPKVEIEERFFLAYEPIGVSSPSRYNSRRPIPECEVYERGTMYRIVLGTFSQQQPISIFKGVYPLYRLKTEEGKHRYFAGGFATEAEADEAQIKLKNMGFRRPEVVVWRDGVYANLVEEREAAEDMMQVFRVEISGVEQMSDNMRSTIDSLATGKDITRINGRFIVMSFAERNEAEQVADAIAATTEGATVEVTTIEVEAPEEEEE
ncbi:MAG: SPOR domain-containing protein [Rikenellaceae bacterium]|nr:SPOR domain-containing protein [Rikenellaceae bacterium]